jgi:hypothetical protein
MAAARIPVVLATSGLHHCRRRRASVMRRPEGRSSNVSFSAVGGGLVRATGLHLQLAQLRLSRAWPPSRDLRPRVAPVSCPRRRAPVQRTTVLVGTLRPGRFSSPPDRPVLALAAAMLPSSAVLLADSLLHSSQRRKEAHGGAR